MSGVAAVLLAAGGGSRFGGGKLLAEFRGKPLVCHALEAIRESPVDGAFVVVGDRAGEVRKFVEPYGFSVVENAEWGRGQSTSVAAGLSALGSDFDAAVVMLGDQPLVGAVAVGRLVRAFEEGASVAVATYGGKPRNPVLFSREVWPELMGELRGDEGARGFLRARWDLVTEVHCDDVANPSDVDTREELAALEDVEPPASGEF
ncbi:MAG: nucleotidyltransferase family protein [Rubrobacter sp.]|nr:nucleotidyltransferase family protein [Rubrobacter sp.]